MNLYYDLNVDGTNYGEKIKTAENLGWGGICLVKEFKSDFKSFSEEIGKLKNKVGIEILVGARISTNVPGDVKKKSRKALEYSDIILVEGGIETINRAASECWEVDVLYHPEISDRDFMDQKNSGMDHIMARFMADRCIAMGLDFSYILDSNGMRRSQIIGKIRQNLMLAKKYKVPIIMTSNAKSKWSMRSPRELEAICMSLGIKKNEANATVSGNTLKIINKTRNRKDPNVIMKGLEVLQWGNLKPMENKRMFGWY